MQSHVPKSHESLINALLKGHVALFSKYTPKIHTKKGHQKLMNINLKNIW